ncbi:MAG: enoyl-CoA hydratase/isomerase family protein [Dethiobacter sp.]|jgi:enoyl-CoA hydratase|nr:enoyl-CoA hydratase/isomerase family protein [Dethiobacter sp.]MBS3989776.1 enoyl-CoA hydratase/isomerase family protein [Dethiobacter sp.]
MQYTFIQIAIQAKIATITINRPEVLNALKFEVLSELRDAMLTLRDDTEVKVVVITGAGPKAFVAGADVAVMAELGSLEARKYIMAGHETFDLIAGFPKPVVAAVNGFALGGGCELALACDFIYAAENARFGLPEITLGIIPGWGGTQRLPQRVGTGLAKEMIYTGKVIDAAEAKAIGLVNKLFPAEGFLDAVKEELKAIVSKSIVPLTMAKAAVNAYLDGGGAAGNAMEIQSVCICFSAQDQKEGMAAFLEKRKPEFTDK